MGIRNPMMLDMPDDEKVMKIMTSSSAKMNENAATYTAAQATSDQEAAKRKAEQRRQAANQRSTLQREINPADDASIRNRVKLRMQQQFGSQSGVGSGG